MMSESTIQQELEKYLGGKLKGYVTLTSGEKIIFKESQD